MSAVTTKPQVLGSRKDNPDATAHSLVDTSIGPRGEDASPPYSPRTHAITCISCFRFWSKGADGWGLTVRQVGIGSSLASAASIWIFVGG